MSLTLATILKAAASSVLGNSVKQIAMEKVTSVARQTLDLPPAAPVSQIDKALAENPDIAVELHKYATDLRIEEEKSYQISVQEQAASERVATQSDSAFVRNARPMMIYLGGLSCFSIIVFGLVIVWTMPEALPDYVDLVSAVSMPLTALLTAGGVYAYRRTTDKAISKGMELPTLFSRQ